jgi:hypothetical protein
MDAWGIRDSLREWNVENFEYTMAGYEKYSITPIYKLFKAVLI